MPSIKIDKGIPMPGRNFTVRQFEETMEQMDVGDSFEIGRESYSAYLAARRLLIDKLKTVDYAARTIAKDEETDAPITYRVWRTE